jgi:hypothetical protein
MYCQLTQDLINQESSVNPTIFEWKLKSDSAEIELQQQLISGCSYLNQFYSSTVHLYNDLFNSAVDNRVGF